MQSRRAASETETESSYDPFRPSKHRFTSTEAEYAKVTILNSSSNASRPSRLTSNGGSARHPALARLQGDTHSLSSSPMPNPPVDEHGNIRELRRQGFIRNQSRSSFASSVRSNASSLAFRKSAGYKRPVSFHHGSRRSSARETPPPRPRAPSPLNMGQRYNYDRLSVVSDPTTSEIRCTPESSGSPELRSRKEGPLAGSQDDHKVKMAKRLSVCMREEARQVSMELEKACDDAFQSPEKKMAQSHSYAAPSYQGVSRHSASANILSTGSSQRRKDEVGSERFKHRPLPEDPPVDPLEESSILRELRDLESARQNCLQQARVLERGALDDVIRNLDRLIYQKERELPEHERKRRITSAPDPRTSAMCLLSPVREEGDGTSYRHMSEPVYTNQAKPKQRGYGLQKTSIRLVDEFDPVPAPLTIRKKPSGASMRTAPESGLRKKMSTDNALNNKSSADKLGYQYHASSSNAYSRSREVQGFAYEDYGPGSLDPIEEDDKENRESRASKRGSKDSKDSKRKGWFNRRSATSNKSSESESGPPPPPPAKDYLSLPIQDVRPEPQYMATHAPYTNEVSEDFVFRPGRRERAVPIKNKFLAFFGKKDKTKYTSDLRVLAGEPSF